MKPARAAGEDFRICGVTLYDPHGTPRFFCTLPPHEGDVHKNAGGTARPKGDGWEIEMRIDAPDLCNLPHQTTDEEDRCDRQHYARGGWVSGACDGPGPVLDEFGCTLRMPSRAALEVAATRADGAVHPRKRTPGQMRAWLAEHRDEHIAQGVPAEWLDRLVAGTYEHEEQQS